MSEARASKIVLNPEDLVEQFTRGSGPGGQHRNKTSSAVHLKHLPSGLKVFVDDGRSQKGARETARELLRFKLQHNQDREQENLRGSIRREQVGSGMRGDKVRTIQVQNDTVVDHRTNKRIKYNKEYLRGKLKDLR